MSTCFVIQPFDGSVFDKRYQDVFKPAVEASGLEPYRVDRDPKVTVPIDSIEQGIRSASACLADITTNNPNVWYELGYAFASGRPVVMVCAAGQRSGDKFPFDIQHRTVIKYDTDSTCDFQKLQAEITERLKAFMARNETLERIEKSSPIAPVEGLTQPEMAVIAATAGSVLSPTETVSAHNIKGEVEQSGFTPMAFALGLRRLIQKGFISCGEAGDFNDNYRVLTVTDLGWDWMDRNESKFVLQRQPKTAPKEKRDDDFPF